MSAYSPISSRSHRVNTLPPYQISATANSTVSTAVAPVTAATISSSGNATAASRRRESLNSSIGATSIRRLLAVNRGCRHKIPVHIRAKVAKNFTFLILGHGLTCAVLVPLLGLQVIFAIYHFICSITGKMWGEVRKSIKSSIVCRHQIRCGFTKRSGCCGKSDQMWDHCC